MEIRESVFAARRYIRDLFGGNRAKRYAIEVDASRADAFDISGAKICESWENGDGSVSFICESVDDLRTTAKEIPGVRRVQRM